MANFMAIYFGLFNAITDTLATMEAQNYGAAREILIAAQQKAEDAYMDEDAE